MKEVLRKILLVICACVFAFSLYKLGMIAYEYYQIDKETTELVEEYVEEEPKEDPTQRQIDFDKLLELNKDVIGWIYLPGTSIDEPILKGKNNDTYLYTDIHKKHNKAGSIFVEEKNKADFSDDNTIIYGHNMKNGSRFHTLKTLLKKDAFEEHQDLYIYTPDGKVRTYKIVVARTLDAYSPLYRIHIHEDHFIEDIQRGAKQKRKIKKGEPFVMLSTCIGTEGTGRFVVFAQLEKITK